MDIMNPLAWTYLAYLAVCVGVTIWVARTLRRHGTEFLVHDEADRERTASLVHLLIVGFYLVNLGMISFVLKADARVSDAQTGIELLSTKVGTILVILGAMHFLIMAVFSKTRKNTAPPTDDLRPRDPRDGAHAVGQLLAQRRGMQ